jgi:hypothetical protein
MNGRLRGAFESPWLASLVTAALVVASMSVTGNLSVGGTSTLTGNTTVGGTLGVTGTLTATGGIDNESLETFAGGVGFRLGLDAADPAIVFGAGSPDGATTRAKGSLYMRTGTAEFWKNEAGGTDWSKMIDDDDVVTAAAAGLAPAYPNNTTTFLRGDGTYAAPSGGTDAFSGAYVYNTTATNTTSGTGVVLAYDSEVYDVGGYHSTSSNTSRLTAPVTGYYHVQCGAEWQISSSGHRQLFLALNSAGTYGAGTTYCVDRVNPNFTHPPAHTVSCDILMSAGDHVECHAFQNSTIVLTATHTQPVPFSIHLIGT